VPIGQAFDCCSGVPRRNVHAATAWQFGHIWVSVAAKRDVCVPSRDAETRYLISKLECTIHAGAILPVFCELQQQLLQSVGGNTSQTGMRMKDIDLCIFLDTSNGYGNERGRKIFRVVLWILLWPARSQPTFFKRTAAFHRQAKTIASQCILHWKVAIPTRKYGSCQPLGAVLLNTRTSTMILHSLPRPWTWRPCIFRLDGLIQQSVINSSS
jgi:hypothetical protein